MKVAAIQTNSIGDMAANCMRIRELIRACVNEHHPRLVVLPENALLMANDRASFLEQTPQENKHSGIAEMQRQAAESRIYLIIGSVAVDIGRDDSRRANRMIVLAPDGSILCRYDKIHMYDANITDGESHKESDRFIGGDKAVMFEAEGALVGCAICYDLRFPHLYRAYAEKGAHIMLAPSAFTAYTGERHWKTLVSARAIETGAYIIAAAQTGSHPQGRQTYGHSMISAPWGDIPAILPHGEGYIATDVDLELAESYRRQIPAGVTQMLFSPPEM